MPLTAMDTVAALLAPVWVALIAYILIALVRMVHDFDPTQQTANLRWHILAFLGLVTALGALVSAPLALIRVYTTERQTRTAEQGHMTDRISKAVEHLGAEKTVKVKGKDADGKDITVEETKPNIEVRIGGLLSLERIAQDSVKYDKGRDHVRVMEILCAYVRENAPASAALNHDLGEWESLKDSPTQAERAEHLEKRKDRFGEQSHESKVRKWAKTLPAPRQDIAIALRIIGRRHEKQRLAEAAWPNAPDAKTVWPFDLPCPALPDNPGEKSLSPAAFKTYLTKLDTWKNDIAAYSGYRPDLRETNLQNADLSNLIFSAALLIGARMEGASLTEARMEGAILLGARMEGADLWGARMEGAILLGARFSASTNLSAANTSKAALRSVDLSMIDISMDQVTSAFGDASVTLPNGITPDSPDWPAHWPKQKLNFFEFQTEWRKWQADPETYTPPPAP